MRIITILLIVLIGEIAEAQNGVFWEVQPFAGRFISHRNKRIAEENTQYGLTVNLMKKTDGTKYWQFAHGYPNMGISLTAGSLGNNAVYGQTVSAVPFLEFDVFSGNRGILQIRHGTGIAWISKIYSPETNPDNLLLGSHLVGSSILDAGYRFFLGEKWDIRAGYAIRHFSNGGIKLPNAGINTGSFYGSVAFHPRTRIQKRYTHDRIRDYRKWRFRTGISFGGFDDPEEENHSLQLNLQMNGLLFRQHNTRFRTGLGIEAGRLTQSRVQTAIYLEEEVQFGRLVTRYGFGGYVIHTNLRGEDFYSKIGIAYYPVSKNHIPEKFYAGLLLKAHGFKAAHVEVTTGYVF